MANILQELILDIWNSVFFKVQILEKKVMVFISLEEGDEVVTEDIERE